MKGLTCWIITCLGSLLPVLLSAQVTLRVIEVPEKTPIDATLFAIGSFNGWDATDTTYQLTQLSRQQYEITFPPHLTSFKYKITRGYNWSTVEGRPNGQARRNRVLNVAPGTPHVEEIRIRSWEDINGHPISIFTFFLLLSAFQGFLIIIALFTIQDNNRDANRILSLIIFLLSLALIGKVSTYDREFFQAIPKVILLPDLILFTYAPLFYWYNQKLLTLEEGDIKQRWLSFVPAILHVLAYLFLFFQPNQRFIDATVDHLYRPYFNLLGALALIFNAYYWYKIRKSLDTHNANAQNNHSFEQNLQYLNTVSWLSLCCLVMWAVTVIVFGIGLVLGVELTLFRETSTDIIWLLFSLVTYMLGYYSINQPAIFKLSRHVEKYKMSQLGSRELEKYKQLVWKAMDQDKVYTQSELTLAELAEYVNTNTHTLSRVINEGFQQPFYDFVNTHRVQEFTRLALMEENKNETFLAIAFRAGFNSKTTFNRAFKKITGATPRMYLKEKRESEKVIERM